MKKIETIKELKTNRLIMRYPELDDAKEIHSAIRASEFPNQLPLKEMKTIDEFKEWIKRLQEHWQTGRGYSWIVEKEGSKELIGQITLSKMKEGNEYALAFWIHPKHWRKGFATEVVLRILTYVFEELGGIKVWAGAGTWNISSKGVLEKVGMKRIGENPKGYYSRGEPIATIEYEITKKSWEEVRK